jgi:glycosyltransferase involved in cell wall biosynthesis
MHNEMQFIDMQFKNALDYGYFDEIVVLDDGSTDGTWDVLQQYARKHNNIHVFRNEKNSVLSGGENRWYTLCKHVAKFEPTWVNNRAADIIHSYPTKKHYRNQMRKFTDRGVTMVLLPTIHLWRSESWYRADNIWGQHARGHNFPSIWRFSKKHSWTAAAKLAKLHQGKTKPSRLGFATPIHANINEGLSDKFPWPIVGLHYGHINQRSKEDKFKWSMECAAKNAVGLPAAKNMPPVSKWMSFNGYKGFIEWGMTLNLTEDFWFGEKVKREPRPTPESFYAVIKKYNSARAEEYKKLFERHIGK